MDFCAGYLSGAVGILVGNPLDVIKVRLQAIRPNNASSTPGLSRLGSAREALRGLPAPVLTYGALNAVLFASYNRSLSLMTPSQSHDNPQAFTAQPTYTAHFIAGIYAGLTTFVISAPTELVKCRTQMATSGTSAPSSSWTILRQTLKQEGLPGLYQGGLVTSIRDAVGYGFYFWTYELSKDAWDATAANFRDGYLDAGKSTTAKVIVCGGLAGVATWVSIFPLDVVKTRVQTQEYFAPSPGRHAAVASTEYAGLLPRQIAQQSVRKGAWTIAKESYRAEGKAFFFRGLGVCCIRAFIVNAVQWGTYEYAMKLAMAFD